MRITFLQQVPASTSPPVSTLPSTTAPLDPTFTEQPEVINTTPIIINYTAGGQQLLTINSPADIYKHFSRKSCEGGLGVLLPLDIVNNSQTLILPTIQVQPVWMENTFVR